MTFMTFLVWYAVAAICWAAIYGYLQVKVHTKHFGPFSLSVIGILFPITIPAVVLTIGFGFIQGCASKISK